MRARSIKPGICDNEVLGTADPLYTLLFERLWMIADRKGRMEDRPLRIKAQAFPYREGLDIDAMLNWLATNGFIARYVVEGAKYIQVLAFPKHQSPHKNEQDSVIPDMDEQSTTMVVPSENHGSSMDALTPDSGLLTPDSGLLTAGLARATKTVEVSRGTDAEWETHRQWVLDELRSVYPTNQYTDADWEITARTLAGRITNRETTRKELHVLTLSFAAQQDAKGNRDTQFIENPVRHYDGRGKWKGPFAIPASAQRQLAEDPMERFRRLNSPDNDQRVIEHG